MRHGCAPRLALPGSVPTQGSRCQLLWRSGRLAPRGSRWRHAERPSRAASLVTVRLSRVLVGGNEVAVRRCSLRAGGGGVGTYTRGGRIHAGIRHPDSHAIAPSACCTHLAEENRPSH